MTADEPEKTDEVRVDDELEGDDFEGEGDEGDELEGDGPESDEPVDPPDERSAKALAFLGQLVRKMQMECNVHYRRPRDSADNEIHLEITGADVGRIIGKKGHVLAAIQLVVNRAVNRPGQDKAYVSVDAEGYRSRRDDSLATMARRLGKQAVQLGKIITFEPMNPRDRRVVHLALAKFEGVVTKSDGEGEDRRVQIIPVRRGPAPA